MLNFIHSNLVRCEGMAAVHDRQHRRTVISIILDPILITTVGWGAGGAAIATIGRATCAATCTSCVLHKEPLPVCLKLSQCRHGQGYSRFWAWVLLPR